MKAWLITWESSGDGHRNGEVVSILNPRITPKAVSKHVERLYADTCYTLSERLDAARSGPRSHNPYPAEFNRREITVDGRGGRKLVDITCGHNPYLRARKVTGLTVREDENGVETLCWDKQ